MLAHTYGRRGAWGLAVVLSLPALLGAAGPQPRAEPGVKPEPIRESVWKGASKQPVTPAEIDDLILRALKDAGIKPAPLVSDEQFLRRVYLDVCGKLPTPAEVKAFLADTDPQKRARL